MGESDGLYKPFVVMFCLMWLWLRSWCARQREQSAIARGARSVTDAREQQAAQALRDRRVLLRQERLGRRQPGSTTERLLDSGASPVVVHAVPLATRPQAAQLDASQEVASAPPQDAVNFCGKCGAGAVSGRFCTGCGAPLGSE